MRLRSSRASSRKVEAVYEMPFLAHAAMEPMNCTVHVTPEGCEVWVFTQVATRAQATAAEVTGLPPEKVQVHNHLLGGGFGRRLDIDGVTQAVRIAKQVDGPVKVVWTREEDIRTISTGPSTMAGSPRGSMPRAAGGLASSRRRLLHPGALVSAGLREGPRCRRRGRRRRALWLSQSAGGYVRQEPPGPSHGLVARRRRHPQRLHRRRLRRRARGGGQADPSNTARACWPSPRGRGRVNLAAAKSGWGGKPLPRRRGVALLFGFGS